MKNLNHSKNPDLTSRTALPNLIVIGAMRAGTTSLHHYLSLHPQIRMSRRKELNFFIEDPVWPSSWQRGAKWYASHFDSHFAVRGEASPSYSNFPQFDGVPERMYSVVPDAKLIYIVRDPIERLISDYRVILAMGFVSQKLNDLLENFESDIVGRSCYFRQIERYLPYYEREQIHIVTCEELHEKRDETLRGIFNFLGVDPDFSSPLFDSVLNESGYWMPRSRLERAIARRLVLLCYRFPVWQKTTGAINRWSKQRLSPAQLAAAKAIIALDADRRRQLEEYLRPDIQRFKEWAGRDFPHWSL